MYVTREYDVFQNKLNDLESSLSLIDQSLKLSKALHKDFSLKEINLARSILVRNVYISVYELFIQYSKSKVISYIKEHISVGDIGKVIQFLKETMKTMGTERLSLEFDDLKSVIESPTTMLEEKIVHLFSNRREKKTYINSIEKLMALELEQELKEDITLFMAMRHVFVHGNGEITNEWRKAYSKPLFRNNIRLKKKKGEKLFLPTDYMHLKLAINTYSSFCKILEKEIKTPTEAGV